METITLTALQIHRLLNAIKETNSTLFSKIENDTSKMCRIYASYDGNETYYLEFTDRNYSLPIIYFISWEPTSWVHNYIFYTTKRVD